MTFLQGKILTVHQLLKCHYSDHLVRLHVLDRKIKSLGTSNFKEQITNFPGSYSQIFTRGILIYPSLRVVILATGDTP